MKARMNRRFRQGLFLAVWMAGCGAQPFSADLNPQPIGANPVNVTQPIDSNHTLSGNPLGVDLISGNSTSNNDQTTVEEPDLPTGVVLTSTMAGGTGCPKGAGVDIQLLGNGNALHVTFPQMTAEAGPDVDRTFKRRYCVFTVQLEAPAGWAYTVDQVTHEGFAQLSEDAAADNTVRYRFAGGQNGLQLNYLFPGGYLNHFEFVGHYSDSKQVWSECVAGDEILNLEVIAKVDGDKDRPALMVVNGDMTFGIRWKRCD